ncbi:hypothetical protein [Amycolatopsis albispora]|uniref:hypothetical protein n=1 Tax=Amycolatopsis albispora TaxID=1804986 RepID=UPI0013B41E0F|nr:hypothetical protein [Amycolatopsis albispora]
MGDKWAERREARRRQGEAELADLRGQVVLGPERPKSLRLAFVLWMVIGVPLVIGLVGIVIVAAAVNLRAGYRGARVWLTAFGVLAVFQLVGVVWVALDLMSSNKLVYPQFVPIALIFPIVALVATVSMWQRDTTEYMRQLREISSGQRLP